MAMPFWLTVFFLLLVILSGRAQTSNVVASTANPAAKKVLLIFSESRDLPGNVMMEQAVRAEMLKDSTNAIEFYVESLDAGRFPNPRHYRQFQDYIKNRYAGQHLDLMVAFMSRDFQLAQQLPSTLVTNLPLVFVVINDLDMPTDASLRPFTGIFQHFDIHGTLRFIFQLQPDTRRVVVIGGVSKADRAALARIGDITPSIVGVNFEFWTNRPVADMYQDAKSLPPGTVILLSTVQRDVTGQAYYTSQIAQTLAPSASVPVYVLGAGAIGGGAIGGNVIDPEDLGTDAGRLSSRVLAGIAVTNLPVEVRTSGIPMVDWRSLQRWEIKTSRLPAGSVIHYRPHSIWETHRTLILFTGTILVAQALTIAGLLGQLRHRRRAEAEILRQRSELAHVARVSTMGQLASALTHELNQPLGAILRNAEAAEIFLKAAQPDLEEVRAILADIRRDDKRAVNVIARMRSLYKRQNLTLGRLDLRELVDDTIALAQADIKQRQVKITLHIPSHLPATQGDRVHLQQVLLNLILNGMDAMNEIPKPKRSLTVRVAETKNNNLLVAVTDCGTGIAPNDAAQVFEPFFTTKSNGMGMGLAISRTIIETHGGDIWME
ncbi:MAG TPA: ABC transporter substrate binding protein, partial [Verrucomicrobiae bacterium]|nr:ABC transporter substrate binding protein [Verrucomicrobiae bacterium]